MRKDLARLLDRNLCVKCKYEGRNTRGCETHHVFGRGKRIQIAGQTVSAESPALCLWLCRDCHAKAHRSGLQISSRQVFTNSCLAEHLLVFRAHQYELNTKLSEFWQNVLKEDLACLEILAKLSNGKETCL